ncbi:MAG: FKBP-type peptidyl-prolyl cis-trans isomerase [Phycisphaeraceae bacterium]
MLRTWMILAGLVLSPLSVMAEDKPAAAAPAVDAPAAADPKKEEPAKAEPKPAEPKPAEPAPADTGPLKTLKEKVSYVIGLNIGRSMARDAIEVDADVLLKGIKDALAGEGTKLLLTEEQMAAAIQAFQQELEAKAAAKQEEAMAARKALGEKNQKEGAEYLAKNKTREGVKTTASGLQYEVLKQGTGKTPTAKDTVRTHYKGTLLDGKQFDSSYDRNEPAQFAVGGVIDGWTEALQMMPVGSKWKLYVPAELAYGVRGSRDGSIGPNAVLVFEVELISIEE